MRAIESAEAWIIKTLRAIRKNPDKATVPVSNRLRRIGRMCRANNRWLARFGDRSPRLAAISEALLSKPFDLMRLPRDILLSAYGECRQLGKMVSDDLENLYG